MSWFSKLFSFFATIGRPGRDQFIKRWFPAARQLALQHVKDYLTEHDGELKGQMVAFENFLWAKVSEKIGPSNGIWVKMVVLYVLDDLKAEAAARYEAWKAS